ncbi:MAG: hypothetical protein ABDH20_13160 [Thermus sp.]
MDPGELLEEVRKRGARLLLLFEKRGFYALAWAERERVPLKLREAEVLAEAFLRDLAIAIGGYRTWFDAGEATALVDLEEEKVSLRWRTPSFSQGIEEKPLGELLDETALPLGSVGLLPSLDVEAKAFWRKSTKAWSYERQTFFYHDPGITRLAEHVLEGARRRWGNPTKLRLVRGRTLILELPKNLSPQEETFTLSEALSLIRGERLGRLE